MIRDIREFFCVPLLFGLRLGQYLCPAKLDSLRDLLVLWNATHGHAAQQVAELSDEDMEALRSLGYMD